jgi:hypothetical protein
VSRTATTGRRDPAVPERPAGGRPERKCHRGPRIAAAVTVGAGGARPGDPVALGGRAAGDAVAFGGRAPCDGRTDQQVFQLDPVDNLRAQHRANLRAQHRLLIRGLGRRPQGLQRYPRVDDHRPPGLARRRRRRDQHRHAGQPLEEPGGVLAAHRAVIRVRDQGPHPDVGERGVDRLEHGCVPEQVTRNQQRPGPVYGRVRRPGPPEAGPWSAGGGHRRGGAWVEHARAVPPQDLGRYAGQAGCRVIVVIVVPAPGPATVGLEEPVRAHVRHLNHAPSCVR